MALAFAQDSLTAPSQLPNVAPAMRSAGFWITRHSSSDHIVMDEARIKDFNSHVRLKLGLTKDIFAKADFEAESLTETFRKIVDEFKSKNYYMADGNRDDGTFVEKMRKNMRISGVVLGVGPRFGLITSFADQRFFPTKEGLYAKRGDVEFDELQNSGLDAGTPVAVVHTSLDKKWYYVLTAISDGWVEADKVALGDMIHVRDYAQLKEFVVITAPQADIALEGASVMARMGNRFPLVTSNGDHWIVQVPGRDKEGKLKWLAGKIDKDQAHQGYLPYTAASIYKQAFRLLDRRYGWGDMNGDQDCSRFLQMVFATTGIELPRDSKNQAKVGEELAAFDERVSNAEKMDYLKKANPGTAILPMKGHIMLFLGIVDGVPYAIHATSGYSQTVGDRQIKYVLNKVVVSDLSLGEHSPKGSLIKRLTKIVGIQ